MKAIVYTTIACGVALLTGCRHPQEATADNDPKVQGEKIIFPEKSHQLASLSVEPVEMSQSVPLHLHGRLIWDDNVTVRMFSPFGGRVVKILVEAGASVKQGDPLALIASPDFGQAQADARKAQTDFAQAERTLNRLRELSDHGAAAQKDLQAAEADYTRAAAEKERTAKRLALYGSGTDQFDQTFVLKSPLDGVVVEKNINPGQEVRPDQMMSSVPQFAAPLFVISDPTRLWLQLDANEQDLASLKPGMEIDVRSRMYPDQTFRGKIDMVSDFLDPLTRTIKVRVSIENSLRLLKAEMFVNVDVKNNAAVAVQVPVRAVFLKGEKYFVFVEDGQGQFTRREIKAGHEVDGRVAVLGGLEPGQRVVTNGSMLLQQVLTTEGGS